MRIPKYRHFKPNDIGFIEWNGKRHYFGGMKYNSPESRQAYFDFVAVNFNPRNPKRKKDDRPPVRSNSATSIAELADRFLAHAKAYYGEHEKSEFHYFRRVLMLVVERYGDMPTKNFGPLLLADLRDWLAANDRTREYKDKNGEVLKTRSYRLTRTTINQTVGYVKRVFKWGVSNELVAPEQWTALQTVSGLRAGRSQARNPTPRVPVEWEVVKATLPKLSPVVKAMVQIQWYTGCRPEQVRLLRPREIDRTQNPWMWVPEQHKSQWRSQSLTLWVGPQAQAVLGPWLDGDPNEYCFKPDGGTRPHYSADVYQKAVLRGVAAMVEPRIKPPFNREKFATAGLVYWTPHQLRHARATEVREQFGLEAAQAVLGHASLAATQIYAKKRVSLGREIALKTG